MSDVFPIHSDLFTPAYKARASLVDPNHVTAFRLFNGFLEGDTDLVVDVYGKTLLVNNYAENPGDINYKVQAAIQAALAEYPWIAAVIVKVRNAPLRSEQQGTLVMGSNAGQKIQEHGVWYAIDLTRSRDASFYLDTRCLRSWAIRNLSGKTVLNTFAYTGSLGIAALAGGATKVVQQDLSHQSLNLAKTSYTLNGFPINQADFITGDFWIEINKIKQKNILFDCVFLDPPFFSITSKGRIDLEDQGYRVINKVRPLVKDGGVLVSINNALYLSGSDYTKMLKWLCADGYLSIEELIPVPEDFIGYTHTVKSSLPVDPSPFNHSTKIAVLRVRRKDAR